MLDQPPPLDALVGLEELADGVDLAVQGCRGLVVERWSAIAQIADAVVFLRVTSISGMKPWCTVTAPVVAALIHSTIAPAGPTRDRDAPHPRVQRR